MNILLKQSDNQMTGRRIEIEQVVSEIQKVLSRGDTLTVKQISERIGINVIGVRKALKKNSTVFRRAGSRRLSTLWVLK